MTRMQWMLVAVAVANFAAGIGVGVAAPTALAAMREPVPGNPDQQFVQNYVQRFQEQFALRSDQIRDLRDILLQFYNDKVRIATSAGYQQWPAALQTQLVQAQRQMETRIEHILDESQRERYRREIQEQTGK